MNKEKRFDWPLCYEAEQLVLGRLEAFTARNAFARRLEERMASATGTLLLDWVDYLSWPGADENRLRHVGYGEDARIARAGEFKAYAHPEAMLPRILVPIERQASASPELLAVRCESVIDFLVAHGLSVEPEGAPLSRYRCARVAEENGTCLSAVERRGYRGFETNASASGKTAEAREVLAAAELWRTRQRHFPSDADGFRYTAGLLDRFIASLGRDLACHVVFAEERLYWQRRNRAAQVQKARQDVLGLGWANHDHHTFRSSREHFVDLMRLLEKLGFERRERYYAGAQAGWGAQILEQEEEGIVAFCDVDLEPSETEIDFSRQPLPRSKRLGTIGLWVGLHGESVLGAGLHHLECRFDYERLREQLADCGVNTMKPFSDFPFLRQAFTEGERWSVSPERAVKLREAGWITDEQFTQFTTGGAIGSHLENLQRKGGFKGFNQKSVSVIIEATDPRRHTEHA